MTSLRTLRTFVSVLVVVFILLTLWSVFNFYTADRAAATPTSHPVATYSALGTGGLVATLLPNVLCNCTQIRGGNVTLFTSITTWVNVSVNSSITLSAPGSISELDVFGVTLSTPDWSKTLYASQNSSTVADGTSATTSNTYSVNVSALENLTSEIDHQLNYFGAETTLTITSTVLTTLTVQGVTEYAAVTPRTNLTFNTATIATGILEPQASGALRTTAGTDGPIPLTAYLTVLAAAAALVASIAWYATLSSAPGVDEEPIPDLEELIAPYEEAIAETRTAPDPAVVVPIERWKDLVKISDTLGKPILRPTARPPSSPRTAFYVIDGDVGYLYRYRASAGGSTEAEGSPGRAPGMLATPQLLRLRVRAVAARTAALPADDPRYRNAVARFRQVQALLQARRWAEAERALADLESFLGSA